uniref:terminase small subunit n=1 Tax=Lentilactobacillus hilgardii TaxID=1588 RepID=UPI00403FA481
MRKSDEAKADYLAGKAYKEIAAKYGVSPGTVRAWKSRYHWDGDPPQQSITKSATQHKNATKKRNVAVEDVDQNSDLNDKQKMFCLYYMQRFNATWAYQKAYGVNWNSAHANGSRRLTLLKG